MKKHIISCPVYILMAVPKINFAKYIPAHIQHPIVSYGNILLINLFLITLLYEVKVFTFLVF